MSYPFFKHFLNPSRLRLDARALWYELQRIELLGKDAEFWNSAPKYTDIDLLWERVENATATVDLLG
jgi:hypothetical protein